MQRVGITDASRLMGDAGRIEANLLGDPDTRR
jgi:hypothetical protein